MPFKIYNANNRLVRDVLPYNEWWDTTGGREVTHRSIEVGINMFRSGDSQAIFVEPGKMIGLQSGYYDVSYARKEIR